MRLAENRAARFHALVVTLAFVHVQPPVTDLFSEKVQDFAAEALWVFHDRNVRSVQFDVACARNVIGQEAAIGRRSSGIVSSGNYQNRRANVGDSGARVKIADRAAASDVAIGTERLDGANDSGNHLRRRSLEVRSKPAWRRGAGNFRHALGSNHFNACVPRFECANFSGGAAQDEFFEASWRLKGHRHAYHSTDRESAEVKPLDREKIGQCQNVGGEFRNRIGWRWNGGLAVASHVITQKAEVLFELRHLCVPDGEIGAERVGKNECGKGTIPRKRIVNASVWQIGERHNYPLTESFSGRSERAASRTASMNVPAEPR